MMSGSTVGSKPATMPATTGGQAGDMDVPALRHAVLAVIVSYNDAFALEKTVRALVPQVERVLIVDNGSSAETVRRIAELESIDRVAAVMLPENRGIGAALNVAVEMARDDGFGWLLTMDQDSIADAGMISKMLRVAEMHADAVVICPVFRPPEAAATPVDDREVKSAITSGNLVKTSLFAEIGRYNESYFIDSVDFEFSLRVRNAGYRIMRCGSASLAHRLGAVRMVTLGGLTYRYTMHSPLRRYYMYRNHLYLMAEFWTTNPVFLLNKTVLAAYACIEIALFDPQRRANFRMIAKGVADFLRSRKGKLGE